MHSTLSRHAKMVTLFQFRDMRGCMFAMAASTSFARLGWLSIYARPEEMDGKPTSQAESPNYPTRKVWCCCKGSDGLSCLNPP